MDFPIKPEKRGRKPGSSLNGDRRVESMGGSAAGGWWGHRGRGGGAGGVTLERRKEYVGRRSGGKRCGKGREG